MEIVAQFLAVYGVTFGLMNDKVPVLRRVRAVGFFDRMFGCSYCTGFHAGWVVRLAHDAAAGAAAPTWAEAVSVLSWGFAGAAFCYVADAAAQWLEASSAGRTDGSSGGT
jgi:hypothetical protein